MFRFMAVLWSTRDEGASAAASEILGRVKGMSEMWQQALHCPGLAVFYAGRKPQPHDVWVLHGNAGVVLGKVFKRTPAGEYEPNDLTDLAADTSSIVQSKGRHLIEQYWGRYVAFIRDVSTGGVHVLRDPQGGLPCQRTKFERVTILFSNVEDCIELNLLRFSTNWQYVAAYVCYPVLAYQDTGVNEIDEIVPGERLTFLPNGENARMLCWEPCAIAQTDVLEDQQEAVEALRRTTRTCVWSWASCYPSVIHALSGGLDSSIVLSCLKSAPTRPRITCLNYFNPLSTEEDERQFARLIAESYQSELIEKEEGIEGVQLEGILDIVRSPKPGDYQAAVRHSQFEGQLANSRQATGMFCGVGGDQVFYQGSILRGLVDYLKRHGFRAGFFQLAGAAARMHNLSIWVVIRRALHMAWFDSRWNPLDDMRAYQTLVPKEVVETAMRDREFIHPWVRNTRGVSEGKLRHIQAMALSANPYDPLGDANHPEPVVPLISQPLIELCLRIPTYILVTGGIDRAIARQAFEKELPPQIAARRGKGGIDTYLAKLVQANLKFLREVMLDGFLVKERLLDRAKVEKVLAPDREWGIDPQLSELLCDHFNTEAWLRSWNDRPIRRAA